MEEKEEKRKKNPLGSPSVVTLLMKYISWGKQKNFKKDYFKKEFHAYIHPHDTSFCFILNFFLIIVANEIQQKHETHTLLMKIIFSWGKQKKF